MKGLSREGLRRQARDPRQTRFQKSRQMAPGARRTGPLYRYGHDQLADRRAILGALPTTSPIDEPDQIQLLGNPNQSSRITDSLSANGAHQAQIRHGRRIGRAQNNLSRERTLPAGVPH